MLMLVLSYTGFLQTKASDGDERSSPHYKEVEALGEVLFASVMMILPDTMLPS